MTSTTCKVMYLFWWDTTGLSDRSDYDRETMDRVEMSRILTRKGFEGGCDQDGDVYRRRTPSVRLAVGIQRLNRD